MNLQSVIQLMVNLSCIDLVSHRYDLHRLRDGKD